VSARHDDPHRLRDLQPVLRLRQAVLSAVRAFFVERDFLEVTTPVRIPTPALEDYIDALPSGDAYLRTSPELHMKRLLAAGHPRLFQIGPCFRAGESGRMHLTEFTMLEWYRLEAGYRQILDDTVALVRHCAQSALGRTTCRFRERDIDLAAPWDILGVDEAFRTHAGEGAAAAAAGGRFETLLVERVEPHLGGERPTVLIDYPLACGALAKRKPDAPDWVERWELYMAGLEVVNACSELGDAPEQRRRFEATARLRAAEGRPVYPIDEPFMAALERGLPAMAGAALGVDRLLMVFADAGCIQDVVAFPAGADPAL